MDGKKIVLVSFLVLVLLSQTVSAFSLSFNDQAYMKSPEISIFNQYGPIAGNITNSSQVVTIDPSEAVFITYEPSGIFDLAAHSTEFGGGQLSLIYFGMDFITKNKSSVIAIIILCVIALYLAVRRS